MSVFLTNFLLFLATLSGRRKVARSVEMCEVSDSHGDNPQTQRTEHGSAQVDRVSEDPERDQTMSKIPIVVALVVREGGWTCAVIGGMLIFKSAFPLSFTACLLK